MLKYTTYSFQAFDVSLEEAVSPEATGYITAVMNEIYGDLATFRPGNGYVVATWQIVLKPGETVDDLRRNAEEHAEKIREALRGEYQHYRRIALWEALRDK